METINSVGVFDLEYFFELSPDLLCVAGYDGYFKKVNPAVSKTLGFTNEELFAAPISSFIYPGDKLLTAQKRTALTEGEPLLNFENRYVAKNGAIVWLSWTSVPIIRDKLVFAIAKNITYKKQVEEYDRISVILELINDDYKKRFKKAPKTFQPETAVLTRTHTKEKKHKEPSQSDQHWLNSFETVVRKYAGKLEMNLNLISSELAVSERQLFRRVNQILEITPNKLVRIIRLQLAWEAIASGKYRTITEIANIAGYSSRAHFSKLFKEIYGIDVLDLL